MSLIAVLIVGGVLRFWNLDLKPLWMDEVITAIFSFGRNYGEIPLEQFFRVSALDQVFQLKATSCANIAQTVSTQSVHPPLFFCWMHQWLQIAPGNWIWKLRSLSALAGVAAIFGMYWLNRLAFSASAGVAAGLTMAVSPFAVYLSQEARHYTVPMLFVIVGLMGLVRIGQDLVQQRRDPKIWMGWVLANAIGFYVHYFLLLAIGAEFFALAVLQMRLRPATKFWWRTWGAILAAGLGIIAICLPWLPTFISHMTRPETDWLETSPSAWWSFLAPLYQLAAGWVVMFVSFPVEFQPTWMIVLSALLMLSFSGWLIYCVLRGLKRLWQEANWETLILLSFVGGVLLEFLAIVYVLGKDLTQVPRYNFIYYPAVCALVGASFWRQRASSKWILYSVGALSCVFVISNVAFLKPYTPDRVAQNIVTGTDCRAIVMSYNDFQDIALGIGFALAVRSTETRSPQICPPAQFAFLSKTQSDPDIWNRLSNLPAAKVGQVWAIMPGLRRADFPKTLKVQNSVCTLNPDWQYRIGLPYSGYQCRNL
ncbi:MAG: glycosyltransferase family 39 protein [Leptolyngbya sp. Prado105]|jgi:uncharacterized membrane protein|nr:glycosyltransferase family 39 protein [Leptolyngbya sp. Prado105]